MGTWMETALDAYMMKHAEIIDMIGKLYVHFENHEMVPPHEIGWGHVGSADHVLERLREAARHLGLEEAEDDLSRSDRPSSSEHLA